MKYKLIRDVTKKECVWLGRDIMKGEIVYKYFGYTYGCCTEKGTPFSFEQDKVPFFELPNDSFEEYQAEVIKNGQLKVWWIPQVPMESFDVLVKDIHEGKKILDTLADYDKFQWKNSIKPDYCNAGGLVVWDEDLEPDEDGRKWTDWTDEETGMNIDEYYKDMEKNHE